MNLSLKNKIILIALTIIMILLFALEIVWLCVFVCLGAGVYLILASRNPRIRKIVHSTWFSILFSVIAIFCIAIFFRLFVFEVYEIPSESMENTLIPGDKVLVNKLIVGPQTPRSPFDIPWINLLFYMNKEARASIDSTWWNPRRLKGWSGIKRNDVLVFENEQLGSDFFIKRCVALPGDEIRIKESYLYVNNTFSNRNNVIDLKKRHLAFSNDPQKIDILIDSLYLKRYTPYYVRSKNIRELFLSKEEITRLSQSKIIDSVKLEIQPIDSIPWVYPHNKMMLWTIDNYGPLKVPYKGWTIDLTDTTYALYSPTIIKWENETIEIRNKHFYLNGNEIFSYTFHVDYYFFMGDNHHFSNDSRLWGFLPENKIVGKSTNILWSNSNSGIKWNRTLKRIK